MYVPRYMYRQPCIYKYHVYLHILIDYLVHCVII